MWSGEKNNVTIFMPLKRSEMVVLFACYAGTNFYVDWYGYCEEIMIFRICSHIFLHLSYSHEWLKSAPKTVQ